MKIKKDDLVKVTVGKDKGKTGEVRRTYPKTDKILIEGVNKHTKFIRKGEGRPGQQIQVESPILVSKVTLICPNCKKATRVGYKKTDKGAKYRICKKCNESVEKAVSKSDTKKNTAKK